MYIVTVFLQTTKVKGLWQIQIISMILFIIILLIIILLIYEPLTNHNCIWTTCHPCWKKVNRDKIKKERKKIAFGIVGQIDHLLLLSLYCPHWITAKPFVDTIMLSLSTENLGIDTSELISSLRELKSVSFCCGGIQSQICGWGDETTEWSCHDSYKNRGNSVNYTCHFMLSWESQIPSIPYMDTIIRVSIVHNHI